MKKRLEQGLYVTLLAVLIILGISAWKQGLAYVYHYQAETTYQQWVQQGAKPELPAWQALEDKLSSAIALEASNATYINDLGRLYAFRALKMEADPAIRVQLYGKAMVFFRQAIALRPAWPHAWANLLLTRARLIDMGHGELDAEFYHALDRALVLGYNETTVQPIMLKVGFFYWDRLPDAYHAKLLQLSVDAFGMHTPWLKRLLTRFEKLEMICQRLPESDKKAVFCRVPPAS